MQHARTGAMRNDQAGLRIGRRGQESGNARGGVDVDCHRFGISVVHASLDAAAGKGSSCAQPRVICLMASARDRPPAAYSFHGLILASSVGAVRTVKTLGSSPFFTSRHTRGMETGAPSRALGDSTATAVAMRSLRNSSKKMCPARLAFYML